MSQSAESVGTKPSTLALQARRRSSLPLRWAAIGAAAAGLLGCVGGLALGLAAHPATALFAIFEVGVPSALVGGLIGVVGGTIALGVVARSRSRRGPREASPRDVSSVCTDLAVTFGAAAVVFARWSLDWASRVDTQRRTTFMNGPTNLLAATALASFVLSLLVVFSRRHWLRWLLFATTFTTACSAAVVALSSIAAANTSTVHNGFGATTTSYQLGAVVGLGAGLLCAGFALFGVLQSIAPHMHSDRER